MQTKREWMTENAASYGPNEFARMARECHVALGGSADMSVDGRVYKIAREVLSGYYQSEQARASAEDTQDTGGFALDNTMRVLAKQPAETVRDRLYLLVPGRAYPVDELSRSWGVTPDTIRKHARREDAMRWVEHPQGTWVTCIMHPETAAKYKHLR